MPFDIDHNSSVTSWKTPPEQDILFSARRISSTNRGFSHICFPFGPADKDFQGDTPQHGYLRDGKGRKHIEQSKTCDGSKSTTIFTNPDWFPDSELECNIEEASMSNFQTLTHKMYLSNDSASVLPVSLGIHWYFATGGQDFTITDTDAGTKNFDQSYFQNNTKPFFWKSRSGQSPQAILKVDHGEIILDAPLGFDELVLWTDNPDEYICIEPVTGRLRKNRIYLGQGTGHHTECRLIYTASK